METYAAVLTYAIPGFIGLIIIEYLWSRIVHREIANSMDTIASLSSGMTNTLKDMIGLALVIVGYEWMHRHLSLGEVPNDVLVYVIAFVMIDFAAYWSHRFNHEINLFWNRHIVHHSSEEFNLSCALRQSISGIIGVYFFLSIPMAIIGIPPVVMAVTAPLHLFAQFWYHTRLIGRMGFLEHILVTPSHHRVHHAINAEYIDKNYAAIFIIWDKMFGTFQEELEDVPAVYGVKKPVQTWNPFIINYQHLWLLMTDTWRTTEWRDKARIWFMPTGWRPDDVQRNYPIDVVDDPNMLVKYAPEQPKGMVFWSWAQLIIANLLLYFMLSQIANLSAGQIALYVVFLGLTVFAYTSLMDGSVMSIGAELIKAVLGIAIILTIGQWFTIDDVLPGGTIIVASYIMVSLVITSYFVHLQMKTKSQPQVQSY
ncbi:MAG: sterol desaturase family protein [Bacteroidota bacterium]